MKPGHMKEAIDKMERNRKQAGSRRRNSLPEVPGETPSSDAAQKHTEIGGENLSGVVGGSRPGDPKPPQ